MPEESPNPFVIPPPEPSVEDTQPMEPVEEPPVLGAGDGTSEPPVPEAPDTPSESENDKPDKEEKELIKDINKILRDYNNEESNIPANHGYWELCARYRAIQSSK